MDSRSRLIIALRALAANQPASSLSYRQIAQEAGVSVATARRHLGDRAGFDAMSAADADESGRTDTRAAIIEAAERVFAEQGYAGASLDNVARAANMTKGAIYWNFESKTDLFCAVLEERCRREQQSIESAFTADFVQNVGLDEVQSILAQAVEPMSKDLNWPRLFIEFLAHAREPEIAERLSKLYDGTHSQIAGLQRKLREAERSDDSVDDEIAARFWTALVDGLMMAWIANPKTTDVQALAREFARIAWLGLSKKNTDTGELP